MRKNKEANYGQPIEIGKLSQPFLENLTSAMTSESAFNCDVPKPSCFEAHLITISNDVSKSRVDKG